MKNILFIIQLLTFISAMICFFWALKYRQDEGNESPRIGIFPKKLVEFYGPKGAKIALIGSVSFIVSGACAALGYFLK